MENYKKIILKLGEIRRTNKITYHELSKKTGISKKHICNIENLKSVPSIEILEKLAAGLGVEIQLSLISDVKDTA